MFLPSPPNLRHQITWKGTKLRPSCWTPFCIHWAHSRQDMLLSVVPSSFRDATDKRSFEAMMIFRHRTLHPGGLNVDFDLYKVSAGHKRHHFCFYLSVNGP